MKKILLLTLPILCLVLALIFFVDPWETLYWPEDHGPGLFEYDHVAAVYYELPKTLEYGLQRRGDTLKALKITEKVILPKGREQDFEDIEDFYKSKMGTPPWTYDWLVYDLDLIHDERYVYLQLTVVIPMKHLLEEVPEDLIDFLVMERAFEGDGLDYDLYKSILLEAGFEQP